jgi:eukaryotic-like serine/threonine-protein kinase
MAISHCIRCKVDKNYKACPHCGEPVTDFLRRYADDPVDGKYQIIERLGTGGMGEVYKVTHVLLGATRVIKVIRPQISESKDAHERFLREARAATKVQHPNVAALHDFSALPDGSHYMVWEYIDGENLAQRIRTRGSLPPRYAVQLTIQALHGLEAIHRAGIVHRDISPENLMITRDGNEERVKIIDMGVAKVDDATDSGTRAGVFVGKLRYASPEHLGFLPEGQRIDGRADLYSMAMVMYEMLTGRPPFEATSPHEYVLLHSRDTQFKPLDLPADLPGGAQLQSVLARALERDRNKRYATAREFATALEEVEKSLPDPAMLRTMNMQQPDTAETWHVTPLPHAVTPLPPRDTLHRSTIRTGVQDAGTTMRTPLPGVIPTEQLPIVPRQESSSLGAIVIVVGIVIVAAIAIAVVMIRRPREAAAATPTATIAAQAQPPAPAPARSQANVDVVSPAPLTTLTTATTDTAATTSSAAPAPVTTTTQAVAQPVVPPQVHKKPVVIERPKPEPVREPEPEPPAPVAVRAYVEGGDSDANDRLLSDLRQHLSGVTKIAVRGSNPEMVQHLTTRLQKELSNVTVADSADTIVNFDGVLERLGRGKKRRSAQATISKNGRVIFRYEMPPEEYRVGDTPAEAFARVLTDAIK